MAALSRCWLQAGGLRAHHARELLQEFARHRTAL